MSLRHRPVCCLLSPRWRSGRLPVPSLPFLHVTRVAWPARHPRQPLPTLLVRSPRHGPAPPCPPACLSSTGPASSRGEPAPQHLPTREQPARATKGPRVGTPFTPTDVGPSKFPGASWCQPVGVGCIPGPAECREAVWSALGRCAVGGGPPGGSGAQRPVPGNGPTSWATGGFSTPAPGTHRLAAHG